MKWVKASERKPTNREYYFIRIDEAMGVAYYHEIHDKFIENPGEEYKPDKILWLDESDEFQSTERANEAERERNKTDCNSYIDRAIKMLKDEFEDDPFTAKYNGIVSLLQSQESHTASLSTPSEQEAIALKQILELATFDTPIVFFHEKFAAIRKVAEQYLKSAK